MEILLWWCAYLGAATICYLIGWYYTRSIGNNTIRGALRAFAFALIYTPHFKLVTTDTEATASTELYQIVPAIASCALGLIFDGIGEAVMPLVVLGISSIACVAINLFWVRKAA